MSNDYQDRIDADALLAVARRNGDLQVRCFNAVFMLDHRSEMPWSIEIDAGTAAKLKADAMMALYSRNDDALAAAADAIGKALRGAP